MVQGANGTRICHFLHNSLNTYFLFLFSNNPEILYTADMVRMAKRSVAKFRLVAQWDSLCGKAG
jgi:hypothetical protein